MLGILGFFGAKNMRDAVIRKNVILSFLYKGVSLATSMLLVPMTIGYLDTYEYEIWKRTNRKMALVAIVSLSLDEFKEYYYGDERTTNYRIINKIIVQAIEKMR